MKSRFGQLDVRGHQERRPEDGVELEDVLRHHVDRRRPERVGQVLALARERQRRVVVEERVEPDVEDVALVPRHGHAPGDPRAGQGDVVQALLDERERLVVAVARQDPVGALLEQPLERLLEGREPEEPVLLLLALELDQVDRALVALDQLGVRLEVGAARAVVALVGPLVDVAGVIDALQHLLDLRAVPRIGGADEEVVRRVDERRHGLNRSAFLSASSRGLMPSFSAASATGSPCSSVPVRKKTSSPRWRMCRASTSAAIVV